jgi:hypothetical protein
MSVSAPRFVEKIVDDVGKLWTIQQWDLALDEILHAG